MVKVTGTTREVDRGEKRIRALIAEMQSTPSGPHVKAGILEEAGQHEDSASGMTVAEIAIINEFGTETIPERAFMRTAAAELVPIMQRLASKCLGLMIDGKMSVDEALDALGVKSTNVIKRTIRDWTDPPNAPATILAKARKTGRAKIAKERSKGPEAEAAALQAYNNPLEDTGQMRNSVNYVKVK